MPGMPSLPEKLGLRMPRFPCSSFLQHALQEAKREIDFLRREQVESNMVRASNLGHGGPPVIRHSPGPPLRTPAAAPPGNAAADVEVLHTPMRKQAPIHMRTPVYKPNAPKRQKLLQDVTEQDGDVLMYMPTDPYIIQGAGVSGPFSASPGAVGARMETSSPLASCPNPPMARTPTTTKSPSLTATTRRSVTGEQAMPPVGVAAPPVVGGAQMGKGTQPVPISLIADDESDKDLGTSDGDNVQLTTLE